MVGHARYPAQHAIMYIDDELCDSLNFSTAVLPYYLSLFKKKKKAVEERKKKETEKKKTAGGLIQLRAGKS